MIQFVYLPNRKKVVKFKRSKENYRGRYKLDGQKKPTDISLYTTDKRVAEQKLEKIVYCQGQKIAFCLKDQSQKLQIQILKSYWFQKKSNQSFLLQTEVQLFRILER